MYYSRLSGGWKFFSTLPESIWLKYRNISSKYTWLWALHIASIWIISSDPGRVSENPHPSLCVAWSQFCNQSSYRQIMIEKIWSLQRPSSPFAPLQGLLWKGQTYPCLVCVIKTSVKTAESSEKDSEARLLSNISCAPDFFLSTVCKIWNAVYLPIIMILSWAKDGYRRKSMNVHNCPEEISCPVADVLIASPAMLCSSVPLCLFYTEKSLLVPS